MADNLTASSVPVYEEKYAHTVRVVSEVGCGDLKAESLEYDMMLNVSYEQFKAIRIFLSKLLELSRGPIKEIYIYPGGFDKGKDGRGNPTIHLHHQCESDSYDFVHHTYGQAPDDYFGIDLYHFFVSGLSDYYKDAPCSSCGSHCINRKNNDMFLHLELTRDEWVGAQKILGLLNTVGIAALEGITNVTALTDSEYQQAMDILHKN